MRNVSLYLDVDGVICPFGASGNTDWGSRWRTSDAGLLEVTYAGELVESLNSLSITPGVRCVWLTSWEEMAPEYLCPAIGLAGRKWPVLASDGLGGGDGWWKLRALQRDIEACAPDRAVWIDDQLDYEAEARAWASVLSGRLLLISPHPRRGLSPVELDAVRAFL
ncbi:hypothetical protein JOE31_002517 [Arthrobacter sp. PvP023]|uniref:HAD domain-containing protein n=1 Tax=Micrococcaceae TaxID=1268 RepID=UPI001AE146BC|nr:HAD domain-containing protein [Arthrobacter sp. PvP023]MBP1136285.1 hypothetical protein [Arthrobacter sp. PvP023]